VGQDFPAQVSSEDFVRTDRRVAIRKEEDADQDAIARVTEAAFRDMPHSRHTEQFVVDALRRCNQLTVSLVAVDGDAVVGHVAISPVTVSSGAVGWYGLGPISVLPYYQRRGIGAKLVTAALAELVCLGGIGCVVLGDPAYYCRFGFKHYPGLELPGVVPEMFQATSFGTGVPMGSVRYHNAFDATA
jgi:predicted N-acetyltransferase YhbS